MNNPDVTVPWQRLSGSGSETATATATGADTETDTVSATGFGQPRPSGPPLASQRRGISVVGEQNGKDCDHADRANGGLMASLEKCSQHFGRGVPGSVIVRSVSFCLGVVPAQFRTRHSRWRGLPETVAVSASGAVTDTVADTVAGHCQPQPSGPPLASQRRVISVVGEQNGKDCDHADHANGGLVARLERC